MLLNERFEARLSDFGTADFVDIETGCARITRLGGTRWMAPEVLRDETNQEQSHIDYAFSSDIFSFGMLALQVSTYDRSL